MAGIIGVGSESQLVWPGVEAVFGLGYNRYDPEYARIYDVMKSEKNYEKMVNHYGLNLVPIKPEGKAVDYDDMAQGPAVTFQHQTYASGFIITREAIEDNLYKEVAAQRAQELGAKMRITKEVVCANVLNRAFNSSYAGGYDALSLCNTAHLLSKGGTVSNQLSTSAPLSEAALETLVIQINKLVDDANIRIKILPRLLVIPPDLQFEAERILKSQLRVGTANNDANAMLNMGTIMEGYTVNHYLTNTSQYFIMTDAMYGLTLFQRRAVETENDTDFDSENMKFKVTERYVVGWADYRTLMGSGN